MNHKWIKKHCPNLKNKVVVVTGATGGLGKEICFALASLDATIVLACRNETLANTLSSKIKEKYPNSTTHFIPLDLSDFKSVNSCIDKLKNYNGIDILINNAGVYNVPVKKLDSGFNNIFQINFLYTYYLTKQLLPELKKKENSTCITLSSIAHNYSKIDHNDVDFSSRKKPGKIYGNSKRFLTFSLYELFRNSGVNLSIVHPGITLTNMTSHYPKCINWLVKFAVGVLFPTPYKASRNVLFGINNHTPNNTWIGPQFCNIWGSPKLKKLKTCSNEESQKICSITNKLYETLK